MFNVRLKGTNEIIKVYSVNRKYDAIEFLIYQNDKWKWVESDNYEPIDSYITTTFIPCDQPNIALLNNKEGDNNA